MIRGVRDQLYQPDAKQRPTSFENPPEGFFLFTLKKTR